MPVLLALALLVFADSRRCVWRCLARPRRSRRSEAPAAAILGTCAFAGFALERLGYRLTMAIALGFLIGVIERQGVFVTLTLAVRSPAGSYLLFDTLLRVPLPRGRSGSDARDDGDRSQLLSRLSVALSRRCALRVRGLRRRDHRGVLPGSVRSPASAPAFRRPSVSTPPRRS